MCDECAYNHNGYCTAPQKWWEIQQSDSSCTLYIEKKEAHTNENP